jgi:hypothetical protein
VGTLIRFWEWQEKISWLAEMVAASQQCNYAALKRLIMAQFADA